LSRVHYVDSDAVEGDGDWQTFQPLEDEPAYKRFGFVFIQCKFCGDADVSFCRGRAVVVEGVLGPALGEFNLSRLVLPPISRLHLVCPSFQTKIIIRYSDALVWSGARTFPTVSSLNLIALLLLLPVGLIPFVTLKLV